MQGECIHELFEARANRAPEAVAVRFGNQALSYRELNQRANQLAHSLRRFGVGPDVLIGLCMTRSLEMVVGILGVLKAGGAYVPLDPAHPKEWLAYILQDTRAPVLLTQAPLLGSLPAHEARVLCLEPSWQTLDAGRHDNPRLLGGANSLAYVIYTSGSTGQPKGVMVPHRGLVNYLTWCVEAYTVAAGTGAPVQSSLSFDLTVTSLFAPLLAGRPVHLLEEGTAIESLRVAFCTPADFGLVKITPAHLEVLGRQLAPHQAAGRTRAFIIGGENLTDRHIAFWQAFAPQTVLVNEYGPTETTVGCCVYQVPAGECRPGSIPIGRPIANTQLYVLDARLVPVPAGAAGELYIGGAGLARGYLNRPDLTAARFLPDPFSGRSGARLYRTGDLVRALPDGNLEFLGRVDRQVKIRGFRIEPAEIETVLARHPAVRQALVVAREDVPAERRLVAYVVPQPGASFTAAQMREFLKGLLPEHMVPGALVALAELPLTHNGKVDSRALLPPARTDLDLSDDFVSPQTDLQTRMVRLWEEMLGIRPIGVRDNFFELGGNSLLAVSLLAQIQKVLGRSLPLETLGGAPTVEGLVKLLDGPAEQASESALVPLQTRGSRPPFFCVHAIAGEALSFADLAQRLGLDQPFYGIQAPWSRAGSPRPDSLEALAARYLEEVRAVQPRGPYYLGGFSFGGTVALEMAQQLRARGQEVGLLAVLDQRIDPAQRQAHFRCSALLELLRNIPCWIWYDLLQTSPRTMLDRLRLKVRAARNRRPRASANPEDATARAAESARAGFDLDRLPEQFQGLLHYHFQILLAYRPRLYPGRVTLLRARAQALSRLPQRDLGWGALAGEGVEVLIVPGSHDTLLKRPYVEVLAQRLGACLERARAACSGGSGQARRRGPLPPEGPAAWVAAAAAEEEEVIWQVVVSQEGLYSLWPADRPEPAGWRSVGPRGGSAECLAYIDRVWSGLRPLSPQEDDRPTHPPHPGGSPHPASRVSEQVAGAARHRER